MGDGTEYVSKQDSVKNVSKDDILSDYEGSAEHELANANDKNSMVEGSADPHGMVGGLETGSGEEDSMIQHILGPAEEIDFMEVENMLEDMGTLESLEVNNKEPRQLGNIDVSKKTLSNNMNTRHIERESPVQ